ncbi:MAG: polymerase sigma factor SigF [Marmoricola sp.]|jgi:RNA polymerase sigma-70 factor (sigma-B/F/G subfamily)|nr:polymerase sigma factor SigF [Marmoricola sp.]
MISLSSSPSTTAAERDARTNDCLRDAASTRDRRKRQPLLDEVVLLNLPVADSIARRYQGRGVPLDDLVQVARLSLVAAANRFDPQHGSEFLAYAVPTMTGDLRKYFRDHGWSVRPPRRLQEAHLKIRNAMSDLTQSLGRTPTSDELADEIDCDAQTIEEATIAGSGYRHLSLEHEQVYDDDTTTLADSLGEPEPGYTRSEARVMLRPLLESLADRDRLVLRLRYVEGLTQREVGEEIGVSQMQVSRILTRIIETLRYELSAAA